MQRRNPTALTTRERLDRHHRQVRIANLIGLAGAAVILGLLVAWAFVLSTS